MSEDRRPVPIKLDPEDEAGGTFGWLRDAVRQVRLAWRLFRDPRVPVWAKLIPPLALAYLISPVDLSFWVPFAGLNALDDVAVVLFGLRLFFEVSPVEVVREHLRALGGRIGEWRVTRESGSGTVIDGEYRVEKPEAREEETPAGS